MRLELFGKEVLNLTCDIDDQTGEGSRLLGYGRVAYKNLEAIRLGIDVVEQRHASLLQQLPRMTSLQCTTEQGEQVIHLPIHDDGIQAFFAAEVLVDDRLGDFRLRCDFLDRDGFESLIREEGAPHRDELLPPLAARHAHGTRPVCRRA